MRRCVAIHSIELCAGVGMLGEGVSAGFEFLGIDHRTICYVEREAAAASQLATLMEAGALAAAPVWSDLLTFPSGKFRGRVDCIIAGFPCQDISIAGRRAGLDGKRSGLFFNILDIADSCGAWCLSLENVSAIATATASVVDEAEGELDERAAARVLGELADRGWDAEWVTFPASEVGASHGRNRWFCFAWRREMADFGCQRRQQITRSVFGNEETNGRARRVELESNGDHIFAGADQDVDNPGRMQWRAGHEQDRPGSAEAVRYQAHNRSTDGSGNVAHAERAERGPVSVGGLGAIEGPDGGRPEAHSRPGVADEALGNSASSGLPQPGQPGQPKLPAQGARGLHDRFELAGIQLADTSGKGREGRELGRACDDERHRPDEHGPTGEFRGELPLFAPGPLDPIWRDILSAGRIGAWQRAVTDDEPGSCPWAPATKPGVRVLADGLALLVGESRNHQLRQVGNGVVATQAAVATVLLVRRAFGIE